MQGPRILIVDERSDTEEVLRAVLSPQGVEVCRIPQPSDSAPRPALVLVDEDAAAGPLETWPNVPQVYLGTPRIPETAERSFAKPFHYADLVRTIEELIAARRAA